MTFFYYSWLHLTDHLSWQCTSTAFTRIATLSLSNLLCDFSITNFIKKSLNFWQSWFWFDPLFCRTFASRHKCFSTLAIKGSQLGAFFPYTIVSCYLEFKLCYLKNLILFSIRIKELFDPTVLRKKKEKKEMGFCCFQNHFLEKTDLWVTLG